VAATEGVAEPAAAAGVAGAGEVAVWVGAEAAGVGPPPARSPDGFLVDQGEEAQPLSAVPRTIRTIPEGKPRMEGRTRKEAHGHTFPQKRGQIIVERRGSRKAKSPGFHWASIVLVQLELESRTARVLCQGPSQYGFLFSIPRSVNVHLHKQLREQRRGTRISSRLCTILAPAFQFTMNQDNAKGQFTKSSEPAV